MQQKSDPHIFSGMQRDISISKHKAESLYDAMNIRFTARDGDTMLSITNERGTLLLNNLSMQGTYLGHCVINNYVVVFTHGEEDIIYKVYPNAAQPEILYHGNLGFDVNHPIETLGVYENDDIQKVYWTDGNNQPRMINVGNVKYDSNNDTQFDFVATLNLNESIKVTRKDGSGTFAPGTIQYAFSYYNKYGRQSNIFYTTLLQYISYPDRGGSPEDKLSNCFEINVKNLQMDFDYLRVYSIHRTSENAVPTVKRIIDIELSTVNGTETTFTDDGQIGDVIDPTELLYIGGEEIVAQTITQKDNTLFFGNLELKRRSIDADIIKDYLSTIDKNTLQPKVSSDVHIVYTEFLKDYKLNKYDSPNGYYNYVSSFDWSSPGFKIREHYRLGVQFQHESGKWSEPVFIGDYTMDGIDYKNDPINPSITIDDDGNYKLNEPCIKINLNLGTEQNSWLQKNGYKRVRPVVVFPTIEDRLILTQGMLCPTVFSKAARKNKTPFSQSSWFLRPNILGTHPEFNNAGYNKCGNFAEYRHFKLIDNVSGDLISRAGEIQGAENEDAESKHFYVDQSIVTMHSPDIEWDNSFYALNYTKWKLNIVGAIEFTASVGAIDIQTSTPSSGDTQGFINRTFGSLNRSKDAGRSLLSGLFWNDGIVRHVPADGNDPEKYEMLSAKGADNNLEKIKVVPYNYLIYPWHRTGSLNNDETRSSDSGTRTAVLKQKKISNLKFSDLNSYFAPSNITSYDISPIQLFASDQVSLLKIPFNDSTSSLGNVSYYGNIDTLLNGKVNFYTGKDFDSFPTQIKKDMKVRFNFPPPIGKQDITVDVQAIEEGAGAVRMKYKSTKHLVFSLTSNEHKNVVCLPTLNNTYNGTGDMSTDDMFWLSEDDPSMRSFLNIDYTCQGDPNTQMQGDNIFLGIGMLVLDTTNSRVYEVVKVKETTVESEQTSAEISQRNEFHSYNTEGKHFVYGDTYYKGTPTYSNGNVTIMTSEEISNVDSDPYHIDQRKINEDVEYPYLLLGELYRDDTDSLNAFNGKSDDAIKSNLWIPAGEPINLFGNTTIVEFTQGDTWYTRYDCLKTYPFTMEDENSIVEIGSFLCESRINGDGRYDRNRGQISNLTMSPINFNLLNPVYNNKDNFFNYRVFDEDYYTLNKFSNQITWSKEKQNAADVDLWTNITMANTFDLDGTMGPIEALRTWQDTIYCFQDNAISVISFNPRVQIPTSDGVPIEISNSYKLEGKIYISDSIGCSNKQTIAVTPSGIYFVDPNSKEFYHIAGKELSSISAAHGFSDWFKHSEITNTFYDKNRNDVYVLGNNDGNKCIVYSELLGQFTSFMNYEGTPAMFNIHNNFYAFRNNSTLDMYHMFAGQYNDFFGTTRPFYIHFISNADSSLDKIFSTIETRVDFKQNGEVVHNEFFNRLRVWNEYQDTGTKDISKGTTAFRKDAKKKFRIWRVNIPRCGKHNLDRIRNTWTNIKLGKDNPGNLKMELHDLNVQYFI